MSVYAGAGKTPNNGQSRHTFLDKLKPKAFRKDKKNVTLMAPGDYAAIPYPPRSPPPPGPKQDSSIPHPPSPPPSPGQGSIQHFNPSHGANQSNGHHNAAPAGPQNTHYSGQINHQRPIDITIGPDSYGMPGYIRVQGGNQHQSYNNYDAHIPLTELIGAGPEQRSAILSTLSIGRIGNGDGKGRLSGGHFTPDTGYANYHAAPQRTIAMACPPLALPAPHAAPTVRPGSPAKSHASHAQSHHSHRSHRSHHSHYSKTPILDKYIKSLAPPPSVHHTAKDTDLSCCVCHARKDPNCHNVKRLASLGDTAICWRCIHSQIGADAGLEWFRN